jgi:ribosome-binding factor A
MSSRIQHKLSAILQRESHDPRFQRVTVTGIDLASDKTFAKVYFAVFPQVDADAMNDLSDGLNRAAGFFSRALARTLETRNSPKLMFTPDRSFDEADKIDRALSALQPELEEAETRRAAEEAEAAAPAERMKDTGAE